MNFDVRAMQQKEAHAAAILPLLAITQPMA
jgi:hypothetical protein